MKFLLASLLVPYILSAQVVVIDSNEEQPKVHGVTENHQLTLDLSGLALSVLYAKRLDGYWFFGVGGGGGYDALNSTLFSVDRVTVELLHAELFARFQSCNYWQIDLGGRISYVGHSPSLIEYGILYYGSFFGGYASASAGFRYLKIGARVIFGHFSNLKDGSGPVILFPMVRVILPW